MAFGVSGDQIDFSVLVEIHALWISADTSPGREADLFVSGPEETEILEYRCGVGAVVEIQTDLALGELAHHQIFVPVAIPIKDAGHQMANPDVDGFPVRFYFHPFLQRCKSGAME